MTTGSIKLILPKWDILPHEFQFMLLHWTLSTPSWDFLSLQSAHREISEVICTKIRRHLPESEIGEVKIWRHLIESEISRRILIVAPPPRMRFLSVSHPSQM
jgi:hypothetical protein